MKRIWLSCIAAALALVADESYAVNPQVKRESSQGAVPFLGKMVSPTDPAPLTSYSAKRLADLKKTDRDDSTKTNDVPPTNRGVAKKSGNSAERIIGVKGWCSCDRDYKSVIVGAGEEFAWSEKPVPGYAYVLCLHCGKCRRPSKSDPDDIVIWDRVKEVQLFQNADSDMTTHDYVKAKMAVQEKLLKIPDGEVVIPGKCSCKEPSPVQGGSAETELVSVCAACGLRCD